MCMYMYIVQFAMIWYLTLKKLRICDLRTGTHGKWRNCDCGKSLRICGFAICWLQVSSFAKKSFIPQTFTKLQTKCENHGVLVKKYIYVLLYSMWVKNPDTLSEGSSDANHLKGEGLEARPRRLRPYILCMLITVFIFTYFVWENFRPCRQMHYKILNNTFWMALFPVLYCCIKPWIL